MLWTEKYSPKNFDEIVGNAKAKAEILEWIEQWKAGNPQKCLLIVGPPGTGKTAFAHIIAKQFSDFIELNASDKRSYDVLLRIAGEASASLSLFEDGLKLIIFDEVDGLHGTEDRGGVRVINRIIAEGNHPIVMTANDPYSKRIRSFRGKCKVIKLRKIHTNSIIALLKRICEKEGVDFEEHILRTLAKRSKGDLRSAIGDLEIMAKGKAEITSEDLKIPSEKDREVGIFDSVRTVLKSKDFRKIKDAMQVDADPPFILELIAENIPYEYEKADEIQKAYDMISLADVYFGRAFSTQTYTYWKYSFDLMSLGVALAKGETYRKFARYRGPTFYTMLSKSRSKRDLRDRIAKKIGYRLHLSKKGAIAQFPYIKIMFEDDKMARDMAEYFGLEGKEVRFFRTRKIKVKKPSKSKSKTRKVKTESPSSKSKKKEQKSGKSKKQSQSSKSESEKPKKVEKQTSLFSF